MNELTYKILYVVIVVIMAIITRYLVPFLKSLYAADEYKGLVDIVNTAVKAAEQTITGEGKGAIKKEEVMTFVTRWLNEKGIKIELSQVDALIEAAVFEMNGGNFYE